MMRKELCVCMPYGPPPGNVDVMTIYISVFRFQRFVGKKRRQPLMCVKIFFTSVAYVHFFLAIIMLE